MIRHASAAMLLCLIAGPLQAAPDVGFTPKVAVAGPTRIDWLFPVSNQSPVTPPDGTLEANYDSKKQSYDLYLPEKPNPKKALPAILFISAADEPQDGRAYEPACKQLGFVFISVRGAGNNVAMPKRTRIILDCFDDVRRQVPLDPDRTYISGFSGGGRMACAIAFALPEYFGGVIPCVAGGQLRDEPYLRHRLIDRLSVALLTGTNDFNRGEVEKYRGIWWKEMGVRSKVTVQTGLGHGAPSAAVFLDAIKFLESGKEQRAAMAKKYPASRVGPSEAPDRAASAKGLLEEGKEKLKAKETTFAGLMMLKGIYQRWPDLDQARQALQILIEYEDKKEKPWEADDVAEQKKLMLAEARGLSEYTLTGIPPKSTYEKQRPAMAKSAIQLWEKIITVSPDSDAAKEGKKRIVELEKLAKK